MRFYLDGEQVNKSIFVTLVLDAAYAAGMDFAETSGLLSRALQDSEDGEDARDILTSFVAAEIIFN
jgi:hypothetical protein